ncbi:OPT superfamily [Ranunculus cassubicifolius]
MAALSPEPENSPVKQVALTVPTTDDTTLPAVTFRMWVLGLLSCVVLSVVNQFYFYRSNPLNVSSVSAQIAVLPLGHLMAKLITKRVFFQGSRFQFTLNPGPFNIKEHVLITIFANSGAGNVYATHIMSAMKLFYKRKFSFFVALIVMVTTQVLGLGIAGIFQRFLVEEAEMWWPSSLVQVSLFGALHDKEKRPKGGVSRNQFFLIALACSFAYCLLPGYLFPMLTSLSWVCWVWKKSVIAQKIGSGMNGLGAGAFALDWSTISAFLGTPLTSPWFATVNNAAGYLTFAYIILPVAYGLDLYKAKTFPFISKRLFTSAGTRYNVEKIVNSNFEFDQEAYNRNGPLYLSISFALAYGFGFAALTATVVHIIIFHGSEIWRTTVNSKLRKKKMDIHTKLMRNYEEVPQWWFFLMLAITFVVSLLACLLYEDQIQLPWWWLVIAFIVATAFTLPIGILSATTNQQPGLNVITEYMIGYGYPGRPLANMVFKVYGYISMSQALTFLQDLKIGHYMKVPPRAMFMAQVVGTVLSALVYFLTGWWLMSNVPHICDPSQLPEGSPWTCPSDTVFYDASVLWGLIGPRRIFGDLGIYSNLNWFFLVGAVLPLLVWIAHKAFPKQKWILLVNFPVILNATGMMPPASTINYNSWILLAFISGFVVYRYRQNWWKKYNYVLSGSLDAGTAFMSIFLFLASLEPGTLNWWGADVDGCPLATCPTAKGVVVKGCPVF